MDEVKGWKNKRLLILLTSPGTSGGAHVIVQEAQKMLELGVDVYLYNIMAYRKVFQENYPLSKVPVVWGVRECDFQKYVKEFDVICASANRTLKYFDFVGPKAAYYIQDFEPYFFEEGSAGYQEAFASYTVRPDLIRVTKTNWNAQEVLKHCGVSCEVIGPSVDLEMFYPAERAESNQVRICAMVRPSTPRRAARKTMEILKRIKGDYEEKIEITIFGSDRETEPDFFSQPYADFVYKDFGILKHGSMSEVFQSQDIFVDFSDYQAMGLTAMEAMACGCAVIVPLNGGTVDFGQNKRNCLMVDSRDEADCIEALSRLIEDKEIREDISYHAAEDIRRFSIEKSVARFLEAIFGAGEKECKKRESIKMADYLLPELLRKALGRCKRIYIYGAGMYAKTWANILEASEILYENFVVSTMKGNPEELYGHDVIPFEDLLTREIDRKEALILIGVSDKYAVQIIPQLKQCGMTNVFYSAEFP